ncbi:CHAP domain-containing protein [Hymenobacter sp. PAMC 26628]|uniref:CHAP domain-containing protein n=1 Tax=Hymenobacter sp. PAMC 26628 TaxID=1484118 RepID=UPI0007702481|nr:CHAP domain-containing protein [Hymenobacter sp. PAMC 26628]AMJ65047.1 hypothetical protein AXW84_06100 [Hymenobacter sp. PAMC 26628]
MGAPAHSPWCACFVSWCLHQAGVATARFGAARSWFDQRHTIWRNGTGRTPQFGDLTGYRWGSSQIHHVGFVDFWGTGPSAQTVEGNTGGGKALLREGDGVFKNWRLKRTIWAVADVVDDPHYTHSE